MGLSKRRKIIDEKVDAMQAYSLDDAIEMLRSLPKLKFSETVDISINLGIDITKSDQSVRGSSTLPHGIGKPSKVVVFAEGQDVTAAKKAGADKVGFEDLIEDLRISLDKI